jgi:hypothetical protein
MAALANLACLITCEQGTDKFYEYVASAANIADVPSRELATRGSAAWEVLQGMEERALVFPEVEWVQNPRAFLERSRVMVGKRVREG